MKIFCVAFSPDFAYRQAGCSSYPADGLCAGFVANLPVGRQGNSGKQTNADYKKIDSASAKKNIMPVPYVLNAWYETKVHGAFFYTRYTLH